MPSSVIAAMVYDHVAQVLEITYHGVRGTYRYYGVPLAEWEAFRGAPSKGSYLNEVFKDRDFWYEKITPSYANRMPHGCLRWPEAPPV